MSRGADDSIGAGLHREILVGAASGGRSVRGRFSIKATGMDERTGTLEWEMDEAQNQAMKVTPH
jgi:hypothetical protein